MARTIRLQSDSNAHDRPWRVAVEQGFFAAEGLDVEYYEDNPKGAAGRVADVSKRWKEQQLQKGALEVYPVCEWGAIERVQALGGGKIIGLDTTVRTGALMVRKDSKIRSLSELRNVTMFTIYIPSLDVRPETTVRVNDLPLRGSERILLVDDEPTLMEMGTSLLERLGYKVTSQTDSVKALEIFRSSPDKFDLVITDYTMPNLTGMDLAKEVRRVRPDMPIMLCTGFSEKITPDSVKELGLGFLMKPYGMRQMSEAIRKILDA